MNMSDKVEALRAAEALIKEWAWECTICEERLCFEWAFCPWCGEECSTIVFDGVEHQVEHEAVPAISIESIEDCAPGFPRLPDDLPDGFGRREISEFYEGAEMYRAGRAGSDCSTEAMWLGWKAECERLRLPDSIPTPVILGAKDGRDTQDFLDGQRDRRDGYDFNPTQPTTWQLGWLAQDYYYATGRKLPQGGR
jgi:hypothetical protein